MSGDTDTSFKSKVQDMLGKMDYGVHVGVWDQLQEWKIDEDVQRQRHRHISELVGWYPGFSVSSIHGYNETVAHAVRTTLRSRGDGMPDQNTGWAKVWRSACWARLNDTETAYSHLKLAASSNFAQNGLSMYGGNGPPFQIDANFGFGGAVLAMLVRDLDRAHTDNRTQSVLLGPAIPSAWGGGSVKGMRLRGGGLVNFSWNEGGNVTACEYNGRNRSRSAPNVQFFVKNGDSIRC